MDSVILENVVRFGLLFVALWAIRKLPAKGEGTQSDRPHRICLYVLMGVCVLGISTCGPGTALLMPVEIAAPVVVVAILLGALVCKIVKIRME